MSLVGTQKKKGVDAATTKRLSQVATTAPRGLEPDVDLEQMEQRLRSEFDLKTKYGPVIGLTRMERWERAQRLGLDPPTWVGDVLKERMGSDMNAHVFTAGKV